jgi:RNA polymerase sigma factor (sigma-70 family)
MALHLDPLLRHLHRLASLPDSVADGELLGRFAHQHDQSAFTELMRRHGPMVLGVCRRVLDGAAETGDTFQAVFLLLARKAASLHRPEGLAAWLHGVARHLALRCRRAQKRRRRHETARATPTTSPDPLEELTARELLTVLDEEIQRLPEVYRLPLILCGLEGLTCWLQRPDPPKVPLPPTFRCLAFSPDGKLLAAGDKAGIIQLWDLATQKLRLELGERKPKRTNSVHALAFTPSGKTLAAGHGDYLLRFWDVATGKQLRERPGTGSQTYTSWHDGGIQGLVFTDEGRRLLVAQDNRLVVWAGPEGNAP